MTTSDDILRVLYSLRDDAQATNLMRFFKTGKGQYGEGDKFLGIKVPHTRYIVKEVGRSAPLEEIENLLRSEWHEARLAGFLLLVDEMKAALPAKKDNSTILARKAQRRDEIAAFYLKKATRADNWDLVDLSCPKILGEWLLHPGADGNLPDRQILDRLARSENLWEQRIGIVTTLRLIQALQFDDTIRIADLLLSHPHDLIHKATGWMLREVGKRDIDVLTDYLEAHCREMHRTTLRYSIEKMDERTRRYWMQK